MSDNKLKLWTVHYFEGGDDFISWNPATVTVEAASEDEAIKAVVDLADRRIYVSKPKAVDGYNPTS